MTSYLLAGGGTAGHVNPLLAVADTEPEVPPKVSGPGLAPKLIVCAAWVTCSRTFALRASNASISASRRNSVSEKPAKPASLVQPPSEAITTESPMRTLACITLSSQPGGIAPGGG